MFDKCDSFGLWVSFGTYFDLPVMTQDMAPYMPARDSAFVYALCTFKSLIVTFIFKYKNNGNVLRIDTIN